MKIIKNIISAGTAGSCWQIRGADMRWQICMCMANQWSSRSQMEWSRSCGAM